MKTCEAPDVRSVDAAQRCGAPAVYVGEVAYQASCFPVHACAACALRLDDARGWRTGKVRKLP